MDRQVVALLSIAVLVTAGPPVRRCLYFQKACVSHCPRQMHPYHTRCDRDTMSQRTCNSPTIYNMGYSCGWSRCDCNVPMLYDEFQGFCVKEDECIKYRKGKMSGKRQKMRNRASKKIRLLDDDDIDKKLKV